MGRELRRVPLDFNWPQGKVWEGFINPHRLRACPNEDCHNGSSPAGEWLMAIVRVLACAGEDGRWSEEEKAARRARGMNVPHPYVAGLPTAPTQQMPRSVREEINKIDNRTMQDRAYYEAVAKYTKLAPLTSELTALTTGLAGRPMNFLGHDSCDIWAIARKITEAAGLDKTWGVCPTCKGTSEEPDEALEKLRDEWVATDPPEGPGYQLWETVSEGSPCSPVFATEKEMIDHLCDNGYSWEAAANFVRGPGWAPSAVLMDGKILKNIEMHKDGPIKKSHAVERIEHWEED